MNSLFWVLKNYLLLILNRPNDGFFVKGVKGKVPSVTGFSVITERETLDDGRPCSEEERRLGSWRVQPDAHTADSNAGSVKTALAQFCSHPHRRTEHILTAGEEGACCCWGSAPGQLQLSWGVGGMLPQDDRPQCRQFNRQVRHLLL